MTGETVPEGTRTLDLHVFEGASREQSPIRTEHPGSENRRPIMKLSNSLQMDSVSENRFHPDHTPVAHLWSRCYKCSLTLPRTVTHYWVLEPAIISTKSWWCPD